MKDKHHTRSEIGVKLMLALTRKRGGKRTVEHNPKHDERKIINKNTDSGLYFH